MKTLYELTSLVADSDGVTLALLPKDINDPVRRLYGLIVAHKDLTNAEAMDRIWGYKDVKAFSSLKSKMQDILIKAISVQGVSSIGENIRYGKVIDGIRKNLVSHIILYRGSRELAIKVLEKSVNSSVNNQLSLNILEQIKMLTLHYGTLKYNKYKLIKYLRLEEYYMELFKAETKSINYFIALKRVQLNSFAGISEAHKLMSLNFSNELESIKASSRTFDFYSFQVFVKRYEFNHEFDKLLALCELSELKFSQESIYSYSSLVVIRQVRLWTLIQLGLYSECVDRGMLGLAGKELSVTNWYTFIHYVIKACLYSRMYNEAIRQIVYCNGHPNYKRLNEDLKELSQLTLGYIHLIVDSGIAGDPKEISKKLPEFKLGKFLNTTPVFSKDKRGINVSILLMHIAFLLQRKDYNAIIDRTDSLNQYAYRYLRKDDSFRSNCMIKMVIQMTKADFHPVRTTRYTADLRKQLSHVTLAGSGENIEVEIIPFEVLWDIMIKAL